MKLPDKLNLTRVLAAPRHSMIYLASDGGHDFVIKVPREPSAGLLEAYEDEYEALRRIAHPAVPRYFGMIPQLVIGEHARPVPALLMEYIDGVPLVSINYLTTKQLKKYILDLGDCLLALLSGGILYTDLHPGNLLVRKGQIKLIDYTCAYYFLRNPYPSYTPKVSYHLDPNLKGQKLLIQSLSFLLANLPDSCPISGIPASLLSLGKNPRGALTFSQFLGLLERQWN